MISFDYILKDAMGLHARPAGQLVKEAKKYASKVTVTFHEKTVEAPRMMQVLQLGTKGGDTITVTIEGDDEQVAATALQNFFEQNV